MALRESAVRLASERGGASWREIASAATLKVDGFQRVGGEQLQRGVSPKLARDTVKNMVRVGELVEVGREKRAGSNHWHALYAPPDPPLEAPAADNPMRSLNDLVSSWARRSG